MPETLKCSTHEIDLLYDEMDHEIDNPKESEKPEKLLWSIILNI